METIQQQETVLTPEQMNARKQQKIQYYMKKKGLSHLQDRVINNLAKLELAMEEEGVTPEDIQAGRGTEKVFKALEDLNRSKIIVEGVLAHQLKKSSESGEFEQIEKESEGYISKEEKQQTADKEIAEALENYQNNPTPENQFEYFKKARGNLSPEERFEREDTERAEKHRRAIKEIEDKAIENIAQAQARKLRDLQAMRSGKNSHSEAREEALNDPRLKKKPILNKKPGEMEDKITARTEEIVAEGST